MTDEPSSPACYTAEADDAYMGFAPREEILLVLNELLEAERAGARVALASARELTNEDEIALLRAVRDDEVRWCAMLFRYIRKADGLPSLKCGAFFAKAMAIGDLHERLHFLNRGQSWVARKLRELMPRVRSDELYGDLKNMLESHESNIDLTDSFLKNRPTPGGDTHSNG
ncbi:DUF6306 domain-containing protein [Parvibaculum sp.]|uniref:DUF6306 domain-containing protein n=1 Tax=Parvibaculum sp. TaxID=2024848 RepID=UPI001D860684|nr:DUF6306 domain-containing protein [Parvibaculum sp.]MBX3488698.1 hypothetical protein [Parvibaculum sp.]MCW5727420.1 hypothetical protein [Parvibaculum sp.]